MFDIVACQPRSTRRRTGATIKTALSAGPAVNFGLPVPARCHMMYLLNAGAMRCRHDDVDISRGNAMRVWLDADHAPHVLIMRPLARELEKQGHEVRFTARDRTATCELLDLYGLPYVTVGRGDSSRMIVRCKKQQHNDRLAAACVPAAIGHER